MQHSPGWPGTRTSLATLAFALFVSLWLSSLGCQPQSHPNAPAAIPRHTYRHPRVDHQGRLRALTLNRTIRYRKVWCLRNRRLLLYPSGRIKQAILAKTQMLQSLPARAGRRVSFYPSGQLRTLTLARNTQTQGHTLTQGSLVRLSTQGRLLGIVDAHNQHTRLFGPDGQPLPCHPRRIILFGAGDSAGCVLRKAHPVRGFWAAPGMIWFTLHGRPKALTLSTQHPAPKPFRQGQMLLFSPQGKAIHTNKRTRPQPTAKPARPATKPAKPARPATKPAQPTTKPAQPTTKPAQPTTQPK